MSEFLDATLISDGLMAGDVAFSDVFLWDLSFLSFQRIMLARGYNAFDSLMGCCTSLGLPLTVQAEAVSSRIDRIVLYGLEFCIGIPTAETSLNRLQARWARALVGCRHTLKG